MSKRNAVAFEVATYDEFVNAAAGAFMFYAPAKDGDPIRQGIIHKCPCGCGAAGSLFFAGSGRPVTWTVSGEWPKVTLSPSIGFWGHNTRDQGYHWHGYLRDGIFEEC